jgi:hypothetical protein
MSTAFSPRLCLSHLCGMMTVHEKERKEMLEAYIAWMQSMLAVHPPGTDIVHCGHRFRVDVKDDGTKYLRCPPDFLSQLASR